jgi:hypothetical protein
MARCWKSRQTPIRSMKTSVEVLVGAGVAERSATIRPKLRRIGVRGGCSRAPISSLLRFSREWMTCGACTAVRILLILRSLVCVHPAWEAREGIYVHAQL